MYFERFYDQRLAQASYLIGCAATGEALVVDPARLVDPYLAAAEAEGLRITAVTETHIHADFMSGLRELAARTGARAYVSGCGPADWQYEFRRDPGVEVLADRQVIRIGNIAVEAVHTPGHTPEHLSFLVTDGAVAADPMGIVTGDFVFVGDVGRPDLLEKAAHVADTSDAAARDLFRSLQWFRTLPDHLQIWPGHGAGSACGKGLGAVPQSTVGYERRYNWALSIDDVERFVAQVLAGQPEPPRYFGVMKRINREGPPVLGNLPRPERVAADRVGALIRDGAVVVDTRPTAEFAAAFIPGSLNVPFSRSFTTYAGSILPFDRDLHVLLADPHPEVLERVVGALVSIGLDRVSGYLGPEAMDHWPISEGELATIPQCPAADLAARGPNGHQILDVRNLSEWETGHVPGARLIPLAELVDRIGELGPGRPLMVMCQTGSRSAIAASLLRSRGHRDVTNVVGGYVTWVAAGGVAER